MRRNPREPVDEEQLKKIWRMRQSMFKVRPAGATALATADPARRLQDAHNKKKRSKADGNAWAPAWPRAPVDGEDM